MEAARSMSVALSSVPRSRATLPAPCAWPQMGSMAPQRPLEVAEAAQEGRGDGLLGEPGEVHADERERDAALGAHLGRNSGEAMLLLLRCCCWWRWCRHGWPAA